MSPFQTNGLNIEWFFIKIKRNLYWLLLGKNNICVETEIAGVEAEGWSISNNKSNEWFDKLWDSERKYKVRAT